MFLAKLHTYTFKWYSFFFVYVCTYIYIGRYKSECCIALIDLGTLSTNNERYGGYEEGGFVFYKHWEGILSNTQGDSNSNIEFILRISSIINVHLSVTHS